MDTTKLITGLSIVASRYTDLMNTYINSVPSSSSSKRKSDDDDDGNDNEEVGNDGPTANSKKIKMETEPLAEEPEEPEDDDRMQKMLQEEESAQEISGDANKSTSAMKEIAPPLNLTH